MTEEELQKFVDKVLKLQESTNDPHEQYRILSKELKAYLVPKELERRTKDAEEWSGHVKMMKSLNE